jgi:hypothetical protein
MNFATGGHPVAMQTTAHTTLVVLLGTLAITASAERIRLNDGTTYEGELGAPVAVTIQTATGPVQVPFASLPPETQGLYWRKKPEPVALGPVTNDDLAALSVSVHLKTWAQVTAFGSFRDKPEKRGAGGLVVTKAWNAIEENWAGVYAEGHVLAAKKHWQDSIDRAKALLARQPQYLQKRWLEAFIAAADALNQRDSAEFARQVRTLKQSPLADEAFALAEM